MSNCHFRWIFLRFQVKIVFKSPFSALKMHKKPLFYSKKLIFLQMFLTQTLFPPSSDGISSSIGSANTPARTKTAFSGDSRAIFPIPAPESANLGDFRPKKCRFSGPKSPLCAEFCIKDRRSPIPASASLDFGAQFCADSCDFDEKSKAPPRKTAFSAPKHAFRPKKVDARGSFSSFSAEI
jgi:hypothetical protein